MIHKYKKVLDIFLYYTYHIYIHIILTTERFSSLHLTTSRFESKTFGFEIDFALPRRRDLERSGKWGRSMK